MLSKCYSNPCLRPFCLGEQVLRIASRSSCLAIMQVHELMSIARRWFPRLRYHIIPTTSHGDTDKYTSLRHCPDNFFTYRVDELVNRGLAHIGIHSAKDYPQQPDAHIIAISPTRNPYDVLICHHIMSLKSHPSPRIGSSSIHRDRDIQHIFPTAKICSIRGTIPERIAKMESGEIDGLVTALAALQRLNISHYPYIQLPSHHPLQGQLLITARSQNIFKTLFFFLQKNKVADSHSVL